MNQTFQTTPEPKLLFAFIFSLLKPNQRFGGVQTPCSTTKTLLNPHALFQIVRQCYYLISNPSVQINRLKVIAIQSLILPFITNIPEINPSRPINELTTKTQSGYIEK
ncbi:hypothetical protein [Marinifilum breve]|uniref:hypothetical protein n=1 Tax=Marinifilum breve TaxID=2184082 RepID=UPI001057D14B|nr:hypothetical protein [Marinifilum breve]